MEVNTIVQFIGGLTVPMSLMIFAMMILSLCLMAIPGALTKHVYPVDCLRSFLMKKAFFYWQLSLEGPLFKVIGACGRRVGRGYLASRCRTPKAFKVKVLSISEMEIAWSPQWPANPFHQEHYVVSYCVIGENDKVGDWTERRLNEEDYHKRDGKDGGKKEKFKEVGKAQRKRLKLYELPVQTAFRLRVCADGPGGRSPWSPEVRESTHAMPDKDSQGFVGPLHSGAPTEVREYKWWQSKHEVGMSVPIPEDWKGRDLSVEAKPRQDDTMFVMKHDRGMILSGTLGGSIRPDEVDWTVESDKNGGKLVQVTLRKEKLMQLWECFIDGHQRIDPVQLQLFHEGNSLNELGTADLWE